MNDQTQPTDKKCDCGVDGCECIDGKCVCTDKASHQHMCACGHDCGCDH